MANNFADAYRYVFQLQYVYAPPPGPRLRLTIIRQIADVPFTRHRDDVQLYYGDSTENAACNMMRALMLRGEAVFVEVNHYCTYNPVDFFPNIMN